jgi:hypothetical protein
MIQGPRFIWLISLAACVGCLVLGLHDSRSSAFCDSGRLRRSCSPDLNAHAFFVGGGGRGGMLEKKKGKYRYESTRA